jgi:hypothetical protein
VDSNQLLQAGYQLREQTEPERALACYAQAMVQDPDSAAAFCNYGNMLRELGQPQRAVPFLQHAMILDPGLITAKFNLAVSQLLMGDYANGWKSYESRWDFEHMAGTAPQYSQPQWSGQDLENKTILVLGEQGHGDMIQFCRFVPGLAAARKIFQVTSGLVPLLSGLDPLVTVQTSGDDPGHFDYWIPAMSVPQVLGITLANLPQQLSYITPDPQLMSQWRARLGSRRGLRVGFCWSGRRDTWINRHKAVPVETMADLIRRTPDVEWVNLQVDATAQELAQLEGLNVRTWHNHMSTWAHTAALIASLDVTVGIDTAVSHLSGALGRTTWIMLSQYAQDWRWLLDRNNSPWYPSAKLFRQSTRGDWHSVTNQLQHQLSLFKV